MDTIVRVKFGVGTKVRTKSVDAGKFVYGVQDVKSKMAMEGAIGEVVLVSPNMSARKVRFNNGCQMMYSPSELEGVDDSVSLCNYNLGFQVTTHKIPWFVDGWVHGGNCSLKDKLEADKVRGKVIKIITNVGFPTLVCVRFYDSINACTYSYVPGELTIVSGEKKDKKEVDNMDTKESTQVFTKGNLKLSNIVKLRNGNIGIVTLNERGNTILVFTSGGQLSLEHYDSKMRFTNTSGTWNFDIINVFTGNMPTFVMLIQGLIGETELNNGTVLFDREKDDAANSKKEAELATLRAKIFELGKEINKLDQTRKKVSCNITDLTTKLAYSRGDLEAVNRGLDHYTKEYQKVTKEIDDILHPVYMPGKEND